MTVAVHQATHDYASYRDFVEEYSTSGWTDGLPVVPPTVQRVSRELEQLGLEPGEMLGEIPSQDVYVTAEQVVINSVMAGCHSSYLPLLIAAARALLDPKSNAHGTTGSLASPAHMVLVNGPARRNLDINCGAGCFGPGRRANATIGRAIRLILRNCCNALYSLCFGEDEEGSDWRPLHVERGFQPESSVVTVSSFTEMYALRDLDSRTPEELLTRFAAMARGRPVHVDHALGDDRTVLIVIGPEHRSLLGSSGWSKQQVRDYLHPLLTAPPTDVDPSGRPYGWGSHVEGGVQESTFGLPKPEGLLVAAAGGTGLGLSWVFYPHWSAAVSRSF
jgi:hypothetical protein